MKKKVPEHKYLDVVQAFEEKKRPSSGLEQELYDLLSGQVVSRAVESAMDIYQHEFKREVLEAFLLAGASPEEIDQILRVSVPETEAYRSIFFDPSVFSNELDVIDYAYEYKKSEFGTELKRYAVDLGLECLKVRMSRGSYVVHGEMAQDVIRSTAFIMAQLARVNKSDSSMANASLKWAQLSLKAAPDEKDKPKGTVEDLKIALEPKEHTTNEEDSGISPDKILH